MIRRLVRLWPALVVLLAATTAFAASGEHDEGIPWLKLIFSTVNLVIFIAVLRRFLMPHVNAWVKDRHDRILRDLNAADEARAEANRLKAEWEQRLAALEGEIATMRERARQDAERERDRILAAAQETAARIQRDAEQAAAAELRQIRGQLRDELTRRAIGLAEDKVRERWTDDDQQRFVANFIEQVQP